MRCALLLLCLTIASNVQAKLWIFGDSLSDVGNLYLATGGAYPSAEYWQGRLSNGPVWVEYLAESLGEPPLIPAVLGGNDLAFAGAETGATSIPPGLKTQVDLFVQNNTLYPNDLCILWGGANDFFNGQTDPLVPATNMSDNVRALIAAGARRFLVMDLPPLGLTPRYRGKGMEEQMNALSLGFNEALAEDLAEIQKNEPSIEFAHLVMDGEQTTVFAVFQKLIADPGRYGFTNVTEPVFDPDRDILYVPDPTGYLFFDSVHPTTLAHAFLASLVVIPEPSVLLLSMLVAVPMLLRRRAA